MRSGIDRILDLVLARKVWDVYYYLGRKAVINLRGFFIVLVYLLFRTHK